MQPEFFTLKNGLRVIFIDTKTFPTMTTLLLIGAGSRYENKKNNGVAHFFEHMAFKGSKKYSNSFIISSTIEGKGGVFNAFTSKDHTGYWIKSTVEHFPTVIDVISDMVLNPLLDKKEIEREKGVISEEINMYEDTPQRKVGEIFEELLYKGNPLGFDIAGTKETVAKFDRETFVSYIKNLYHPENAVLILAGGLKDTKKYLQIVEEKFKDWKNGQLDKFIPIKESQASPQILVKYKKTEQAHLTLGFRAFSFKDDRKYSLNVLSAILGGGMSSRLFMQVRERRGLCYYISTGAELYHDCGNIVTQAGVTIDLDKVKEAIRTILEEHKKIIGGEIKEDELKRAKELIKGRLLLSLEDSANIASFFGNKKLLLNTVETPQEVIEKIDKVTSKEILILAKQIFVAKGLNFALIGPFKDKNSFVDVVNI
ncbi:insulinase family protein [Candidatus Roizmanbacteria bacterium]|nr:insulinase family protein [Candidatus Roizmanbacteria bacterium]